jgi:hypothetical protein
MSMERSERSRCTVPFRRRESHAARARPDLEDEQRLARASYRI